VTWGNIAAVAPGAIQTPAMPASGVPITNQTGGTVSVYLTTGAVSPITAIALGGVPVTGLAIAAGLLSPPIRLAAGSTIAVTWTGVNPPTWQWLP